MDNDSETLDNGIDISDDNKVIVDKNLSYSFDKVFQPEASQVFIILFRKGYIKPLLNN